MADEIPSLADLRRSRAKRIPSRPKQPTATPFLFDPTPTAPTPTKKLSPSAQDSTQNAQPLAVRVGPAQVYTVAELVRRIRSLVERTYGHVTVEGEISNWRPASSGHCYFTLKDGDAQLSIVLFRRQAQLLRFRPKDGDAVRISGSLSVYESRGQLQLVAETMQQTGLGALLEAVRLLKDRLRREGLFANARPLPPFPHCIGVVTSLQGAALRDIVKVCRRRHAAINLLIYPAAVQGPNCAAEVAAGVHWFSEHSVLPQSGVPYIPHSPTSRVPRVPPLGPGSTISEPAITTPYPGAVDVVLIARGGGSWEDLHGFDDETLARTIAACSIPVITGIGHAPDSTIADAAADLCAPTPSAAAEILTAAQHGIADRLSRLRTRLERANRYELLTTRQRLSHLSADAVLRRVRTTLERHAQHLDELSFRAETTLNRALRNRAARLNQLEIRLRRQHVAIRLTNDKHRLNTLQQRLHSARSIPLSNARTRLNRATTQLEALSPLRVLDRGYALVYLNEGGPDEGGPHSKLLRNATEAPEGSTITAQLSSGRLRANVTSNGKI